MEPLRLQSTNKVSRWQGQASSPYSVQTSMVEGIGIINDDALKSYTQIGRKKGRIDYVVIWTESRRGNFKDRGIKVPASFRFSSPETCMS
jgi:hypothetical protein